ncbi:MAG: hypothetical protein GF330_13805, partial [Candidatus Eisenbacteria bacterium]|nr:hypothetical protein [Candidatus Eisenbacteria bacterium]
MWDGKIGARNRTPRGSARSPGAFRDGSRCVSAVSPSLPSVGEIMGFCSLPLPSLSRVRLTSLGCLMLVLAGAVALTPIVLPAQAASTLQLEPSSPAHQRPTFELLRSDEAGVHCVFELPALQIETYEVEGVAYQTIDVPGGQLHGEVGAPALPAFTRLVALPDGVGATLRIVHAAEETLPGFYVLPMQALEGETFERDRTLYREDRFLGGELVSIGDPSRLRDLRVVPVTFRPVRFNPQTGELRIARRIEFAIDFAGTDLRAQAVRERVPVTPGFGNLHDSIVINFGQEPDHPRSEAPHLGTWVCIARDNATVLEKLEPLVAWRQRMGYNVVVATTSETGSSSSSIRNWLEDAYQTWDYPPEYITLVGDVSGGFSIPTTYETYSGCSGEGDHYFVQLDGSDLWPDAFIGRLSAENTDDLELIVNKIVGYESSPAMGNPDWFTRACLVGDPSYSGPTCIQIQQWLKERMRDLGFADIDTVWSGPFTSQIRNSLNQGATYFGYRGYYGMSGWDNGDINALYNGWEMLFAINLTCGTGSFSSGTAINEAWLRAGTPPNSPDGGIGAIATATICTHTRYNNCFYAGAAYGLYWEDHYKFGPALARGKAEMILNYEEAEFTQAARYIWWNNLMGDPATEIWSGEPEMLTVTHPATLPLGSTLVDLTVRDSGGSPVKDAWVYLFREGELGVGGYTDGAGAVTLPIDAPATGTVLVTVTGHDLHPYQSSLDIVQPTVYVAPSDFSIDDDASGWSDGNSDGVVNPGEKIELEISLTNFGTQSAEDVQLTIATEDPFVGLVTQYPIDYGTIGGGATVPAPAPVQFRLHEGCPVGHEIQFDLRVDSGLSHWPAILSVPVDGATLAFRDRHLADVGDGVLDPGESGRLVTILQNFGSYPAEAPIELQLISDSYAVHVTKESGTIFDTILPGNWRGNWDDRFEISAPSDVIVGTQADLRVVATFADGAADTIRFTLEIGTGSTNDPTGPDAYGYYAYDDTDTGYDEAPTYDWIDIVGVGSDVGVDSEDGSRTVDLPFSFTYYGQTFDRATICTNGWMSMGHTYLVNYRNWHLPSANGPANMLSPFWDNLYEYGSGRVYHWYDAAHHRYVVAWDNLRNEYGGAYESFEVILYDPAYYPTATGDGVIVFQYETVNNSDSQQMYSTVGIQDAMHTTGITFNYFNRRPSTAAALAAGLAVKF